MNQLRSHFAEGGAQAVGNNATEIYSAKKSGFWLSPSYNYENVIRIDFLYFLGNIFPCNPKGFFEQCCAAFDGFKYRCHWGKYIPDNYEEKVEDLYPKYCEWKNIRNQMDPCQVNIFAQISISKIYSRY